MWFEINLVISEELVVGSLKQSWAEWLIQSSSGD